MKFREKQANTKQELRRVRRDLRQDEESLEFWTKVINIGAMPVCVAIVGLAMAAVRKQKTKAK